MIFHHNIDPELFNIGPVSIRWYGLLFVIGLVFNIFFTRWLFKKYGRDVRDFESVALYLILGMIIGARLGHALFYNLDYFLDHPLDIFMIWQGGLSSHGAAIGVFIAYLIWIRIHKVKFSEYVDILVIGMPLTALFVRLGNFVNSEIIGRATSGEWGVVFERLGENITRHPTQLYEAGQNLIIFTVLVLLFIKFYKKLPSLSIMFVYIFLYFSSRFVIEFWKERHILMDGALSMGQILSVVLVLISLAWVVYVIIKRKRFN